MELNIIGLIDNTYLRPYGSTREIETLIEDTARYGAYSITINPIFLRYAREYMARKAIPSRWLPWLTFHLVPAQRRPG